MNNPFKTVIPQALQNIMVEYSHDDGLTGGHVGIYRSIKKTNDIHGFDRRSKRVCEVLLHLSAN